MVWGRMLAERQRLVHWATAPPTSGEVQTWDACVAHLWAQYRQRPDDEAGTFARALERELGALWTFIVEEGVEPTNNRAERALQCAVLWRRLMRCGRIDWHAIALLYEGLVRAAPTLGALVGRAAALAEASGPAAGFALLDDITPERVKTYQPYWAVRVHLLRRLGRQTQALDTFDRAIGLMGDGAIRQLLLRRRGQEVAAMTEE